MDSFPLHIDRPRPYFAEFPYYLWGEVNYDSEGYCKRPTDRNWTCLELTHRDSHEHLEINKIESAWVVEGETHLAARASLLLCDRSGAKPSGWNPVDLVGKWDHELAMARRERVEREFSRPEFEQFDSHYFWASWKWLGGLHLEFMDVGRWVMESVVNDDERGVFLCAEWLKHGTFSEVRSRVLRYALERLTGQSFQTDKEWVKWYYGGWFSHGHKDDFPEPDYDKWLQDLKALYG